MIFVHSLELMYILCASKYIYISKCVDHLQEKNIFKHDRFPLKSGLYCLGTTGIQMICLKKNQSLIKTKNNIMLKYIVLYFQ